MSYPYLSDVVRALTGYDLPLPFATFGLLLAYAALAAAACLTAELRRLWEAGLIQPGRRQSRDAAGTVVDVSKPPQELVPNLTLVVLLAGIAGARLFHIMENMDQFLASPWAMIFSRSGLSVFGGLIAGTLAGLVYVRRWQLQVRLILDAVAPAMMLGYSIGRVGCQVSGDGDWGIRADLALKPEWLPTWLWAQTYDNNIYGEVIAAPGVYPTPVYESLLALLCFALLWMVRKHPFRAGWLFSFYLILAGLERLLIEQIRVNPVFSFGSVQATQAEIIAVMFLAGGLGGISFFSRKARPSVSVRAQ